MKLNKIIFFVGLAGIIPQIFLIKPVQPQSTVEQKLCKFDGQYFVFAQRPLQVLQGVSQPRPQGTLTDITNNQLAHEHIFFCKNGTIERNVGFGTDNGTDSRFSEDTLSQEYELIDDRKYDSDLISSILGPDQCYISEAGTYDLFSNNCQDFTARVRRTYWQRIFIGTWEAQQIGNQYQMSVGWNSAENRYEGRLSSQGEASQNVGFSIGELVWIANFEAGIIVEYQKWRYGRGGISSGYEWRKGLVDIDRSTIDMLATPHAFFRRVTEVIP